MAAMVDSESVCDANRENTPDLNPDAVFKAAIDARPGLHIASFRFVADKIDLQGMNKQTC
jgi:hypothetical protein